MATSNLFTTWSDANKQMIEGKTQTITCTPCDDPQYAVVRATGGGWTVGWKTWYKATCVSSASFRYIGMTRTAAEACAAAMTTKFTRLKPAWQFQRYQESDLWWMGWRQQQAQVPVLDSNIRVVHEQGAMYSVTVECNCTDEKFTTTPATISFDYPSCMDDI